MRVPRIRRRALSQIYGCAAKDAINEKPMIELNDPKEFVLAPVRPKEKSIVAVVLPFHAKMS